MEIGTKHAEMAYWYTRFEDPNCVAVVELVATLVDADNGVQVRTSAVLWSFEIVLGIRED